jgi:hypothetical protein
MAAKGLYNDRVRIARRCEFKPPTEEDMEEYDTRFANLLEDSVRVVRGEEPNTPKQDVIDLFTNVSAYISPAKQALTPKPKRSYAKEDVPSPYLPDSSAEKLAHNTVITPKLAQKYIKYMQSNKVKENERDSVTSNFNAKLLVPVARRLFATAKKTKLITKNK